VEFLFLKFLVHVSNSKCRALNLWRYWTSFKEPYSQTLNGERRDCLSVGTKWGQYLPWRFVIWHCLHLRNVTSSACSFYSLDVVSLFYALALPPPVSLTWPVDSAPYSQERATGTIVSSFCKMSFNIILLPMNRTLKPSHLFRFSPCVLHARPTPDLTIIRVFGEQSRIKQSATASQSQVQISKTSNLCGSEHDKTHTRTKQQLKCLRAFTKLKKRLLLSSCLSVSLSVCQSAWNNSVSTEQSFIKYDIWVFFENLSKFEFY
jgi:hypothetical protein